MADCEIRLFAVIVGSQEMKVRSGGVGRFSSCRVPTAPPRLARHMENTIIEYTFPFPVTEVLENAENLEILVQVKGLREPMPISVLVTPLTEFAKVKLLMAAFVLVGLYVLIIFEICHRTLAAMLGESTPSELHLNAHKTDGIRSEE